VQRAAVEVQPKPVDSTRVTNSSALFAVVIQSAP
jgi:hypothetical protein